MKDNIHEEFPTLIQDIVSNTKIVGENEL